MKNKSKGFMIFAIVLSVLLAVVAGLLIYQIYTLNVLPTKLLIPTMILLAVLSLLIIVIINFVPRSVVGKVFSSIFTIAMVCVFAFGNWYMYSTASMFSKVTKNEGKIKNTVSIITKASSSIDGLEDLSGKVATLKKIDTYGTEKCLKSVEKKLDVKHTKELSKLPFEIVEYTNVAQEIDALFNNDVEALVMNESYRSNVLEMDKYTDFDSSTKVIYQAVYYTKKSNDALVVGDVTTTPFNILVSGNDTYGEIDEVSRSDVNMVVTVNPVTSTVLLTSIPRDMYVETTCDAQDACLQGALDKITHVGMHGVNASKRTVENFLDIEINYTYRVNFSSVINLVDALGGIEINVPEGQAVPVLRADGSLEGVVEGKNQLDGKRALAFARERYAYADGDNQRVRNQQEVMMAIIRKATSPSIISNYASFMDALSGAFETNMSQDEITTLLKYQLQASPEWKFETYQVQGTGGIYYCAELGQGAYATIPDNRTVRIAKDKIMAVMNGKSSDTVDTSFLETTAPEYNYYEPASLPGEDIEAQEEPTYQEYPEYIEQDPSIGQEQGPTIPETETPVAPEPEKPDVTDPPVENQS